MNKQRKYIRMHLLFLTFLFFLNGCQIYNTQQSIINLKHLDSMTGYETFDIKPYKDKIDTLRNLMSYNYTKEDGTEISIFWKDGFGAQIDEIPPKPSFYRIIKRFNADGSLIEKGAYIGSIFSGRIEKWLECDENGDFKVVDYEKNRGRFGYMQVLKFLEKKKQINLKTGKGRERITINYSYENTCWEIMTRVAGTYIRIKYTLDGNTGKILNEEETVDEV